MRRAAPNCPSLPQKLNQEQSKATSILVAPGHAMETQKNRVIAALSSDLNPLADPADLDIHSFVDAVR